MPSWFKDSVPQFLYKYVTRDRWDVLKNREIRFTQFDDFNDPFETQHKSRVSEVRSFQSYDTMRSRDYWSTAMTGWTEDRYRSAVSNWTDKDLERRKKELRRQEYIDASVPSLGVLSLAAIPDHLAMWTHYSAGFTGLVIKFDTSSSFFSTNLSRTWFQQHDDLFKLRRVRYESSVPSLRSFDPLESLEQIIFTKGENWSYEQEWRLCRPLAEGRIRKKPNKQLSQFSFFHSRRLLLGRSFSATKCQSTI